MISCCWPREFGPPWCWRPMKLATEPCTMKSYQLPMVKQGTFILSKCSEQSSSRQ